MVLETIISPIRAEERPWKLFFIGMVFSAIAFGVSYIVFGSNISLIMLFLVMMASIPLVFRTMRLEEKKDIILEGEGKILKEHSRAISVLVFLFLGFSVSFMIIYVLLPGAAVNDVFAMQIKTINAQGQPVTGNTVSLFNGFSRIFFNNLRVMIFSYVLSFFYGTGAIFILTWNASILGVALGNFFKTGIANYGGTLQAGFFGHLQVLMLSLLRYFMHGIPEIMAYLVAGLAGGILSFAVIRHDLKTKKFFDIFQDSLDLMAIAIFLIFVAGIIEVFIMYRVF